MRHIAAIVIAAGFALGACATSEQSAAGAPDGRDCFRAASVSGFEIVDDNNIRVRVGASRSYTLHTSWDANDLDWAHAIALRSSSGWICTGSVAGAVELVGGTPSQTYPIDSVARDPDPPGQTGS